MPQYAFEHRARRRYVLPSWPAGQRRAGLRQQAQAFCPFIFRYAD